MRRLLHTPAAAIHGLFVVAALAALSACSGGDPPPQGPADLALACQIAECKCLGERGSIFTDPEERPILWREKGDAYCPPGFTLQRVEPPARR